MDKHVVFTGGFTGLTPEEIGIDLNKPYTACRVCGALFQSTVDRYEGPYPVDLLASRLISDNERVFYAMALRKRWSINHAQTHSDKEHLDLAKSGMWCTPEAAIVFATYGIIAVSDAVLYDETEDALRNASPIPVKEVEGVLRGYL